MARFWFEVFVQAPIITGLWLVVARDAAAVKVRRGAAPGNISAFAWGALAGLTWVGVVPYVLARRRALREEAPTSPAPERNLSRLWLALTAGAAIWSYANFSSGDGVNGAEHLILTALMALTTALVQVRDRRAAVTAPRSALAP